MGRCVNGMHYSGPLRDTKRFPVGWPEVAPGIVKTQRAYKFDRKTGVLEINPLFFPGGTLEHLSQIISWAGDHQMAYSFLTPTERRIELTGIREVRHLSPEEAKYTSLERIADYFRNF